MLPYTKALQEILSASDVHRVTQASMQAGAEKWNESYNVEPQKLEKGIYTLRAMISQMANHKTKGRLVPRQFRGRIDALFAMVRRTDEHKASDEEMVTDESNEEAEVLEVPKVEVDVELIRSCGQRCFVR